MKEQKINERLSKYIDKTYEKFGWNPRQTEINSEGDLPLKEASVKGADYEKAVGRS
jgi:hypothetical protein